MKPITKGTVLNDGTKEYTVKKHIGTGGFADVYMAENNGAFYAIKVEHVDFCFKGQSFAGINEGIRFMEGEFAFLTSIPTLLEKECAVSVGKHGMDKLSRIITMDFHLASAERACCWFGL